MSLCIWELGSSCSMATEVAQNGLSESSSTFPPSSSGVEVFGFPLSSTTDVQYVIVGF